MTPYYSEGGITIYHGDCREILPTLHPADLVLADPPYGLGRRWSRTSHGSNGRSRLWTGDTPEWDLCAEQWMFDVGAHGADSVIWGANNFTTPPTASWLVWDKAQKTTRAECEIAWSTLRSGNKTFRMTRIDAYFNKAWWPKEHPCEKPVQLYQWCIGLFSGAASVVDPFMGSGTSLAAAKSLGVGAIGIEIEERYCEIAAKRLSQGVLPMAANE
jgi:site-specific DNA-methyltransferase (adenine-specific)